MGRTEVSQPLLLLWIIRRIRTPGVEPFSCICILEYANAVLFAWTHTLAHARTLFHPHVAKQHDVLV